MSHDQNVKEIVELLKERYEIYADHIQEYKPFGDFKSPSHYLSAYIPTQSLFNKRATFSNPDWEIPDIVIKKNDLIYVIDIIDDNDNNTSIARKIETIISNATQYRIIGMMVVSDGTNSGYRGKINELKKLQETFNKLFNGENTDPDNFIENLKILFKTEPFKNKYKEIKWEKIKYLKKSIQNFEETLKEEIEISFNTDVSILNIKL